MIEEEKSIASTATTAAICSQLGFRLRGSYREIVVLAETTSMRVQLTSKRDDLGDLRTILQQALRAKKEEKKEATKEETKEESFDERVDHNGKLHTLLRDFCTISDRRDSAMRTETRFFCPWVLVTLQQASTRTPLSLEIQMGRDGTSDLYRSTTGAMRRAAFHMLELLSGRGPHGWIVKRFDLRRNVPDAPPLSAEFERMHANDALRKAYLEARTKLEWWKPTFRVGYVKSKLSGSPVVHVHKCCLETKQSKRSDGGWHRHKYLALRHAFVTHAASVSPVKAEGKDV